MHALNMALLFLTLVVAPLVAWKQIRWASVLLGVVLFLCQADILFVAMDSAGRGVANQIILPKGNAREVNSALTALTALKDAQWPMRISILLAGAGLLVLTVIGSKRK